MISSKVQEAETSRANRRLRGLAVGFLTAAVAIGMAMVLRLHGFEPQNLSFHKAALGRLNSGSAIGFLWAYLTIVYGLLAGSSSLTARDRPARFRIIPILWTGALATATIGLWPFDRPDGIAIAAMIAAAVQVVSPWNHAASLYARYLKMSGKQKRTIIA